MRVLKLPEEALVRALLARGLSLAAWQQLDRERRDALSDELAVSGDMLRAMNGGMRNRLHQALLSAFPSRADLEFMVRLGIDESLEKISTSKNLQGTVLDLIVWAEANGRIQALRAAARTANPGNPMLRSLEDEIANAPPSERPVVRPNLESAVFSEPELSPGEEQVFIVGNPIANPRHFHGRANVLKRLGQLLKRQPLQHAAIVGPRRSGKTSLLLNLAVLHAERAEDLRPELQSLQLPELAKYRWTFVDFQDARLSTQRGLLHYLARELGLPHVEAIDMGVFVNLVIQHLRRPVVLMLDELGAALTDPRSDLNERFWLGLRALISHQAGGRIGLVVATDRSFTDLARTTGYTSPLANIIGYATDLGPLTEAEARSLVGSSPVPFAEDDVRWILETSGRWPILIQTLCRERLLSLEAGEAGWREEAIAQMKPYRHLLEAR